MRRRLILAVLGLLFILGLGSFLIVGVQAAREAARRSVCVCNLKCVAIGLLNYHDRNGSFPVGTVTNPGLPPERRLGWRVALWGEIHTDCTVDLDPTLSWNAPANFPPKIVAAPNVTFVDMTPDDLAREMTCPDAPVRKPGTPYLLSYVGMAGVGVDAPTLPEKHPRAGVFGYDRRTRIEDITDGTAHTVTVIETARDNRPWTAGGPARVRVNETAAAPYLGRGRQFGGYHPNGANAAFADGSVRFLRDTIDPRVLACES